MMRIATILGARPQFVKAAAVSRALEAHGRVEEIMIHTGQHFDDNMSRVFFDELSIRKPDYHLDIHGLSHGAMTGRMLEAVERILLEVNPDAALVFGDTDSTLAGALAAVKLHIPVAHVEAGLRAFNMHIPEEVNRVLTDHITSIFFTPTDTADRNLANEGISAEKVFQVGDVMYDAALHYAQIAEQRSTIIKDRQLSDEKYVLVTLHRPQNVDSHDVLGTICETLEALSGKVRVVWPVHPRTRNRMEEFDLNVPSVMTLPAVGFLDMIQLEKHASLVLTDSGGVQKEAYFHGIPCVTMRPETEWTELVETGWNVLMPPDSSAEELASRIYSRIGTSGDDVRLYGSGKASERIAGILFDHFGGERK